MINNFSVVCPSSFLPFLCVKRKYVFNLEGNLEALHKVMQDLNAMRNDVLKRVSKEEEIGLQVLQEVKEWISKVEKIEPEANRLLDESVSKIHRLSRYGYCSLIPASTYHYSEKVHMTLEKVKTLRDTGVFEVVFDRALLPLVIKKPSIQLTFSQQDSFERACNFLEEKNVGTLGIYGMMSGIGKTTILTRIKETFQEAFDLVIFVVVASGEVESIHEEISNRLNIHWGRETKEENAAEIFMALKGKRFLLLLDDIQKRLRRMDLEEIGVPFPSRENGCKIVFTSQTYYESRWIDAKVEITCLRKEEAWDLFQKIVGENTLRSHQDIPKLARVVASLCRGLPFALNLIGETMARKRTVSEWRYTIHVLASSTAKYPKMKDGALPILKSIYDNISDENTKLCFLYCAQFPKNLDIRKEDLVNYWILEGILAKEDREKAKIQGYEIICDLVRMRLLAEGGNEYYVKMHGMVREMALWIASDFSTRLSIVDSSTLLSSRISRDKALSTTEKTSINSESAIGNQVEKKIEEQWIKVEQRFSHFNNRDFSQMAEDPKMDGSTSESHPLIQNIDLVRTTRSEKTTIANNNRFEKRLVQMRNMIESNMYSLIENYFG